MTNQMPLTPCLSQCDLKRHAESLHLISSYHQHHDPSLRSGQQDWQKSTIKKINSSIKPFFSFQ